MTFLGLIALLRNNYYCNYNEYQFFMNLIDHCIDEGKNNPFESLEKDTIERGIRGQNGLNKSKLRQVNQLRKIGRLAKYINDMYPEEKQYIIESQIKAQIPEFNPDDADFAYPCEDLFFQLLNAYINTTNKRTKKNQANTPTSPDDVSIMIEPPTPQPVVQQFVQNQFNISQTGNGVNIGHADIIEIHDGKVVTLK